MRGPSRNVDDAAMTLRQNGQAVSRAFTCRAHASHTTSVIAELYQRSGNAPRRETLGNEKAHLERLSIVEPRITRSRVILIKITLGNAGSPAETFRNILPGKLEVNPTENGPGS